MGLRAKEAGRARQMLLLSMTCAAAIAWMGGCDSQGAPPTPAQRPAAKATVSPPAPPVSPLVLPYGAVAARIEKETRGSGRAYALLQELTDDVGARISGSPALEQAIAWAVERLREGGHEVQVEPVKVDKWVRGAESLQLLEPRPRRMPMLGLGGSVGTPSGGITAEVVVVHSKEELSTLGDKARGKIVLFDVVMPPYDPKTGDPGYGKVVGIRVGAARMAAEVGAVAALVRSLTANSLGAPHAGAMRYDDAKRRIPAAAITVEDAALLSRLQARGKKIVVKLTMGASDRGMVGSANVVAQLDGHEHPEQVVVMGGHLDSWDVGQGAQDDGAGVVTAIEALNVLRRLQLTPRRSVRVVLWTNEETALAGAKQYALDHAAELGTHVAGIESDSGGAPVVRLMLELADKGKQAQAHAKLAELEPLLQPLHVGEVKDGYSGADLEPLRAAGVPGIGLLHDMSHYFDIHHSEADTLDKVRPEALDQSVATLAITAFVLADMPQTLR
jgi:Zn-dependent M28 family amino/carboxypeptidase